MRAQILSCWRRWKYGKMFWRISWPSKPSWPMQIFAEIKEKGTCPEDLNSVSWTKTGLCQRFLVNESSPEFFNIFSPPHHTISNPHHLPCYPPVFLGSFSAKGATDIFPQFKWVSGGLKTLAVKTFSSFQSGESEMKTLYCEEIAFHGLHCQAISDFYLFNWDHRWFF